MPKPKQSELLGVDPDELLDQIHPPYAAVCLERMANAFSGIEINRDS